ncbi:MAG: FHA domain-containing protein [Bdellovibrionota bacterium]
MLELRIIKSPNGEIESFEIPGGRSIVVGRAEECAVRLSSAGISKKHCVITPISLTRVEVEDLGSSNGTYINGLLIKKHIMQPGDTLSVHNFVLQLVKKAPDVSSSVANESLNNNFMSSESSIDTLGLKKKASPLEKIETWLEDNVYPSADKLSASMDVRLLCLISLAVWTLIVTSLSLSPFKNIANERSRNESIQVARLYARQMVAFNQRAVIEQRYKDLVADLDSRRGETPGLSDAKILDVVNAQILAPPEQLGQSVSRLPEQMALSKDREYINIDEANGVAYVSLPIKIGTSDGNKTVAVAFVEYRYLDGQFTLANLVEQIVNSIFWALIISGVFLIFIYRWTDGSLRRAAAASEEALREEKGSVSLPIQWPSLQKVMQEISYSLTQALEGSGDGAGFGSGNAQPAWAIASVSNTKRASAAFDSALTVLAWNKGIATLVGIQESMAIGSDISQASRDIAFESAVRELAEQCTAAAWAPHSRNLDFGGRTYRMSMIGGSGAFLLNVETEEG